MEIEVFHLLADVTFSTEGISIITGLLVTLAGAIGLLFRMLMAQVSQDRDTWKNLAQESVAIVDAVAAKHAAAKGSTPHKRLAATVPEHNSPITAQQREDAALNDSRAALVAARKELGIPPRTEQEEPKDLVRLLDEDWAGVEPDKAVESITLTGCTFEIPDNAKVTVEVPEGKLVLPKEKVPGKSEPEQRT